MQHTVAEMFEKICAMKDLAQLAHNEKYARPSEYDMDRVTHLVESIQALAGDIFNDRTIHPKLKEKQKDAMWTMLEDDAEEGFVGTASKKQRFSPPPKLCTCVKNEQH